MPLVFKGGRSFAAFMEKSIKANLDASNLELCALAHSYPPPSRSNMSSRMVCVSWKLGPMARKAVSSTNAKVHSVFFRSLAISIRSELYMTYRIMESGSPWPIPLVMGIQSDRYPSNLSWVHRSVSKRLVKSMRDNGRRLDFMLCNSLSVTAFGNAPSISRNKADTTLPCLQASLIVASSRCSESVVDLPGLPPK